ncbi:MAG: aminopeptidase N, partial [Gammaproteobacteria bacterium]|nr:aminopeptidase N [Gammaproteobacteria bacterium]
QKDLDKCGHAMRSLKNAMRWDEQEYGREYDLDLYMIVAVDFFNMGAMENKGLNIFNTSCVLAHRDTQTDAAFQRVEAVVAHEYFHNWSGNRVTCRDWFQLSLKEGFTVFRDASFSAAMNSATVKRIEDVSLLRSAQFAEDAGPMAHPVRPESYIEISNFYTLTIYEKGAEVIRMLHQLLGAENFRRGTDLYFERHDGQAVTCEDFILAMEQASGMDLDQFRRWYAQAGTPVLEVTEDWDPQTGNYQLCISQHCPATPGQATKQPFFMPVNIALLGAQGILPGTEQVLQLGEQRQAWTFAQLPERPVPALLRGFSAPVNLHFDYSYADLLRLLTLETDGFARWDASQRYMMKLLTAHIDGSCALTSEQGQQRIAGLADALAKLLSAGLSGSQGQWHASHDAATLATLLQLPEFSYVIEQFAEIDIAAIDQAVRHLRVALAQSLRATLITVYQRLGEQLASMGDYQPEAGQIALRSLKNTCMQYLALDADASVLAQIQNQFAQADNMTERASALAALVNCEHEQAAAMATVALQEFYQRYQNESLVVNQWFTVQVAGDKPGALQRLQALLEHPAYDNTNPNKVRALLGAFCARNLAQFHAAGGSAYMLLADEVLRLDSLNPQLAARLLAPMTRWRRFAEPQRGQMQASLERIAAQGNLSADVFEVVSKTLASAV